MNLFTKLDFMDFHFNGKRLSDFGGYVGSTDEGYKTYSVLPSRERVTDRPLNSDVTYQFASSLQPRVFEVPVIFEQLTDSKLREVAAWLDSPTDSKFWWIGDDVFINAMLDSQDFDANSSSGQDGQIVLKFICLDPYYYKMEIPTYTVTDLVSDTVYTYTNNGTSDLFPHLNIACNGDITITIANKVYNEIDKKYEFKTYSKTEITDIVGGVKINSETRTCTLFSEANHFAYIDKFPVIPKGEFKIKIVGSDLTNFELIYREKFL